MENPLIDFNRVGQIDFFIEIERRRGEFYEILNCYFTNNIPKKVDGIKYTLFSDPINDKFIFPYEVLISTQGIYILECYDELERIAKLDISSEIYKNLDISKNDKFIRYTIKQLQQMILQISNFELKETLISYLNIHHHGI